MSDTAIFGLRFKSNEALHPAAVELSSFMERPRMNGMQGTHQDDLAVFIRYLGLVDQFEQGQKFGVGQVDFGERMLLGVLSHTRFFKPALRFAIEEYKYHRDQLEQLDFKKPEAFVRSAAEEMQRYSPKRREDQPRIARLQALIDQRKKDLESLSLRRRMIAGELFHIAVYVRENIVRIRQLCEDAIAHLVKLQVGGKKTEQLIEDLKSHFKEQVKERREMGAITPEYLDSIKAEVAELSRLLTQRVLEDIYSVTGIYEGFFDHARQLDQRLETLIGRADRSRKSDSDHDDAVFVEIETELIALIAGFPTAAKTPVKDENPDRHGQLLQEKRREMLDHVFTLLTDQVRPDAWTI